VKKLIICLIFGLCLTFLFASIAGAEQQETEFPEDAGWLVILPDGREVMVFPAGTEINAFSQRTRPMFFWPERVRPVFEMPERVRPVFEMPERVRPSPPLRSVRERPAAPTFLPARERLSQPPF